MFGGFIRADFCGGGGGGIKGRGGWGLKLEIIDNISFDANTISDDSL